jgi:hypothetical protein
VDVARAQVQVGSNAPLKENNSPCRMPAYAVFRRWPVTNIATRTQPSLEDLHPSARPSNGRKNEPGSPYQAVGARAESRAQENQGKSMIEARASTPTLRRPLSPPRPQVRRGHFASAISAAIYGKSLKYLALWGAS